MARQKSAYVGAHGAMVGLLALAGFIWWLRRPDGDAQKPLGQLPG